MLGKRLLVIEDDIDSLHAVSELLRAAGHEVLTAETGREGLRILHAGTSLDLVLLDFWLPDMTGHALLATRTRWPGALSLPVLLVTGDDAWVDEHRDLRQLGVVGLLRKPLDAEQLLLAVERSAAAEPIVNAMSEASAASEPSRATPLPERDHDTAVAGGGGRGARQARRFSDLLTRASDMLAQSTDASAQLRDLTRLVVPDHAELCVIERADALLSRQVLCAHHERPAVEPTLRAMAERSEGLGRIVTSVLETGEAQLYEALELPQMRELGYSDTEFEVLRELGFESVLVVPMVARRRVFGTIVCASTCARRRYARSHLEAFSDLAHRVALALDNEQLHALAQHASRAREQMLALLSRDLRTPLSNIVTAATKAFQSATTLTESESASTILRSARRMENQIRDLLDYAQLEAGSLRVEPKKERLAELLRRVVEASRMASSRHVLELEIDSDVRDSEVACDAERIKQVLSSLIDHALRVSAPNAAIGVRMSQVEGELHITVTDAAPSFAADEITKLFDWTRRSSLPGEDPQNSYNLALRLAIARGLVEAHGGRLWVQSHPKIGNSFHFTIGPSAPAVASKAANLLRPILLVDSDLAFRRELKEILVERGYGVETADNGWQAWNYLQANPPPALILLDLMMPIMDGWELHAAIKSHPELSHVPTVIVSGLDRYRIEASLSDAQGYIEKPIRTAQLFEVVQRHVASPARPRAQSLRPEPSL